MFKRVLVPLDGSALAESALTQAKQLAKLVGAGLHLVRVVDTSSWMNAYPMVPAIELGAFQQALVKEESEVEIYLGTIASQLRAQGFETHTALLQGRIGQSIARFAEPGDVIVMTTHGRGGLARWFLGSVAEELVRHARAPILLVRTSEEVAELETGAKYRSTSVLAN